MSETPPVAQAASAAPEKPAAAKKTKKPAKAAAPRKKPAGPSVSELIVQAVSSSKERSGVSLAALKKSLAAAGYDVEKNNSRIKLGLKSLVSKGTLVQTKGTGASGSFKLNKKAEAKSSTTKVSVKAKASGASKKPKKTAGAAAKKTVKTPKKPKKPAVSKKPSKSPKKPKVVKPKKVAKSPAKAKAVKPKAAKAKVTKPKTAAKPKKAAPKKKSPFSLENLRPHKELENIIDVIKEMEGKDDEMLCEDHDEKLDLLCEDEGQLLCWSCNWEAWHKGHSVALVEDMYQGYKEKHENTVTKLSELRKDDKFQIHLMTTEINTWKLSSLVSSAFLLLPYRIQSSFKNIQNFLHEEEKSYLWRLENEEEQVLRRLKGYEANLQQQYEKIDRNWRQNVRAHPEKYYRCEAMNLETLKVDFLKVNMTCNVSELYFDVETLVRHHHDSGFCSLRYGLALIMHFSNFTMITQRVSLSIAIIAMVNSTQHQDPANAATEGPLTDPLSNRSRSVKDFGTRAAVYQWSTETQGIIFSSISYGIILTLIPSGYLAGIFGAKHILGAGLLISSLLTLFTPMAAEFGVILVIAIRTVQGMAQVSRRFLRPSGIQISNISKRTKILMTVVTGNGMDRAVYNLGKVGSST
ncbi:hypothetical protein NN561_015591 [Cricetulus griseus]